MKQGYLSQYFRGVAVKRLSAVEADVTSSNQHEFNGVKELCDVFGKPCGKVRYRARFLYLSDNDEEPLVEDGFLTWYDSRQKAREERGVMRWEYRLYFHDNPVLQIAAEGDLLVIARCTDNTVLAIVAQTGTTIERQIMWLFGFSGFPSPVFHVRAGMETEHDRIDYAVRIVLEQIGIEPEDEAPDYLEEMLVKFGGEFPRTIEFSAYARSTIPNVSGRDNPDLALVAWMEREESLFRTLEKHLLGERLRGLIQNGNVDTELLIKLVQSALQRRKSRAGFALENHLEELFACHGVTYTRTGVTERNLKPDFIFPGILRYHDINFPQAGLTMLAVKSTCRDRWRQVLNEAARIPDKHLLTLEPGISNNQTEEMKTEQVQLVIPRGLQESFTSRQRKWLMDVSEFLDLVRNRQRAQLCP